MKPVVKICGITRLEDGRAAADAGTDFIGFVFASRSPRFVAAAAAAAIARELRNSVRTVGVFVDPEAATVNAIADAVGLDFVQLHGGETDALCAAIARPVIKAYRVGGAIPSFEHPAAAWTLYDASVAGVDGGSGTSFAWELLTHIPRAKPLFLAGGLHAGNVRAAIAAVAPDGVDVSSGVERVPGVKDHQKIREFIEQVRQT